MVSLSDYNKLCFPAKIYLIFSLISIVFAVITNVGVFAVLLKILFVGLWAWLLNTLCVKGFEVVSWILVLLPFIVMLGLAVSAVKNGNVKPAAHDQYKLHK
jgi:hypothetical protein